MSHGNEQGRYQKGTENRLVYVRKSDGSPGRNRPEIF